MAYPAPTKKPLTVKNVESPAPASKPEGGNLIRGLVTLVVFLIIVIGGIYLIKTFGDNINSPKFKFSGEYQAVFLTNGQVYFGKIFAGDEHRTFLRDIYYLQVVTQPLQRTQEAGEDGNLPVAEDEQRLTLIKLGNELHGPKDEMMINSDHIILLEDLRDDSRVVQAIKDYKAGNR